MAATNFSKVESVVTPFNDIEVSKYRSSKTGLTVVVANTEGNLLVYANLIFSRCTVYNYRSVGKWFLYSEHGRY
jgi:hypothetical protein